MPSGSAASRRRENSITTRTVRIHPLHVVDRDQGRPGLGDLAQQGQHSRTERSTIRRAAARLAKERHPDRALLGPGKVCLTLREDRLEQVRQRGEGQFHIGLRRARGEDTDVSRPGELHSVEPEGRLPDARFTLEHQHGRTVIQRLDEQRQRLPLGLTPNDHWRSPPRPTSIVLRTPAWGQSGVAAIDAG